MPFLSTYSIEDKIIVSRGIGTVSVIEIGRAIKENIELSLKHNCHLWLIDFSDALAEITIMQLLTTAEKVPVLLEPYTDLKKRLKRAFVTKDQFEVSKFYENASVNRGLNFRVFIDIDSARKWLKE
jgi:hypothetical protein